jgi:hypothetical protein
MPIIKSTKAENGVPVAYHKATKLDINLNANTAFVTVQSYTDEDSAKAQLPIVWNWSIPFSTELLAAGKAVLVAVEEALIAPGATFEGGELTSDRTAALDVIKDRKRSEITAARLKADAGFFTYTYTVTTTEGEGEEAVTKESTISKNIRTADKDMFDLLVAQSMILMGEMPPDWPGGWKAIDNTYVPIATPEEWKPFYLAMYRTGIANYRKSQGLKAQIEAASTVDEATNIRW